MLRPSFMVLQFEVGTKGLVSGFLVGLRSFRKIQVKGGLKLAQGVGQDSLRPSGHHSQYGFRLEDILHLFSRRSVFSVLSNPSPKPLIASALTT